MASVSPRVSQELRVGIQLTLCNPASLLPALGFPALRPGFLDRLTAEQVADRASERGTGESGERASPQVTVHSGSVESKHPAMPLTRDKEAVRNHDETATLV
jgi:hypothetical protein